MKRVEKRTVSTRRLTEQEKRELYGLFEQYYVDVSFECFCTDLSEKTHLFIFRSNGRLVGFSTIFRKRFRSFGKATYLFSGDTVVHRDFWGSKALQKVFFWYILSSKIRSPFKPVYWMLISKGYKTYLMMRRNFANSFPRFDSPIPAKLKCAMDTFYRFKFGEAYDPEKNLIWFQNLPWCGERIARRPPAQRDKQSRHRLFPSGESGIQEWNGARLHSGNSFSRLPGAYCQVFLENQEVPLRPLAGNPAKVKT